MPRAVIKVSFVDICSSRSGQPGSGSAVMIRWQATLNDTTAHLWVIEGVIVSNGAGQLNRAKAYAKLSNYTSALQDLNTIRERSIVGGGYKKPQRYRCSYPHRQGASARARSPSCTRLRCIPQRQVTRAYIS